jgi:long-chain acyl-CoA synthetase
MKDLSANAILRVLRDLAAAEMMVDRHASQPSLQPWTWMGATLVSEGGLGADSLDRLKIAGAANQMFHLHEDGSEDALLVAETLGEMADFIAEVRPRTSGKLTFRTGGSTGAPKLCTHAMETLREEVAGLWNRLTPAGAPQRVVSMVPAHHIYGFLWTVLAPDMFGVPVADRRGGERPDLKAGDLVVGAPVHWDYLFASRAVFPGGVGGLVSTAPVPPSLWAHAGEAGVSLMTELYGSSETGGVGFRTDGQGPLSLMPHLSRAQDEGVVQRISDASALELPDIVAWDAGAHFRVTGRKDGAVQVGGVNVFPARIADQIKAIEGVSDCAVRLGAGGRLKAFLVLSAGVDTSRVETWIAANLSAPERPKGITVGDALPRDALGKLCDW